MNSYIHTYTHTYTHSHIQTYIHTGDTLVGRINPKDLAVALATTLITPAATGKTVEVATIVRHDSFSRVTIVTHNSFTRCP